jgi:N-acetylneuraminic acid mutarotase
MQRIITVMLLAGGLAMSLAAVPGDNYLYYDDGTRHHKSGYNVTEVGWGVKFTSAPGTWVKLTDVEVNLCPPEIDGPYTGKVLVYEDDGTGGLPGTLVWSGTYDIRVGEWWHYITIPGGQWMNGDYYVFNVIAAGCQYPQYCYQWYDGTDNAPSGTQWYKNASGAFVPDNTAGDIEIRVKVQAHDIQALSIEEPGAVVYYDSDFSPQVKYKNLAGYAETGVPVTYSVPGVGYSETKYVDFAANEEKTVTFSSIHCHWTPGSYTTYGNVALVKDWNTANDEATKGLTVHFRDVGPTVIHSPYGTVLEGSSVPCRATVKNFGTETVSFPVQFRIYDAYGSLKHTADATVTDLAPGGSVAVSFTAWTAGDEGEYEAQCESYLTGDVVPANNEKNERFYVDDVVHDVGVTGFTSPPSSITRSQRLPLRATVKNYGSAGETFGVRCSLIHPDGVINKYNRNVTVAAGATEPVTFTTRRYNKVGVWKAVAWSRLTGDDNPRNDTFVYTFTVTGAFGWGVAGILPGAVSVNKGAALTSDGYAQFFAVKGRNSPEVYVFNDELDEPAAVAAVPQTTDKIGAGTSIAFLNGTVYVLKANKSREFYGVNTSVGQVARLTDLPLGGNNKPAKNGARLVTSGGLLYALKGNKTNELYAFDPKAGSWTALASMPAGEKPVGDGAGLVASGGRLFVLRGNKTQDFYTYDIASNGWQKLADLPVKAKAGAGLAVVGGTIYATVGGSRMDFYSYNVLTNEWTRLDDVILAPDNRKVKDGGAITGLADEVLVIKGKKSDWFLSYAVGNTYGPRPDAAEGAATASRVALQAASVTSPAQSIAYVTCSFPVSTIQLYSSTGALVRTVAAGQGSTRFSVADLANGTYVVKFVGNTTVTRQLVVQH